MKSATATNDFACPGKRLLDVALSAILCILLLSGCTARYFKPAPLPEEPLRIRELGSLSYRELWQGYVFNGEKVGFSHLEIEPAAEGKDYIITSTAHLSIRFLGMARTITIKSVDIVKPDLSLVSFHYEQDIGGKNLTLDGAVADGKLSVAQRTGGEFKTTETKLATALYPASAINLYPVLRGMKVGRIHRYPVYDPQTQTFVDVSQSVVSFEESEELHLEPAFRMETDMSGHTVSSWINTRGETIFELGMGGVLITCKESEASAKTFLMDASLNKKDVVYDFSLIKTDKPVTCPRKAAYMEAAVEGVSGALSPLREPYQEVREKQLAGKAVTIYRIHRFPPTPAGIPGALSEKDRIIYLAPSGHIESNNPLIRTAAAEAGKGARTPREKVASLVTWVAAAVKDEAVDSYSAVEVLNTRRGECKAHAMLYTAMARASGIPTRVAGGVVYIEGMGFLYHAWAESYLDGWVAVDPSFAQVGADATHIKLAEGHDWSALMQLGKVIGRLKIKIITFTCQP